jgi:hypothetical protein
VGRDPRPVTRRKDQDAVSKPRSLRSVAGAPKFGAQEKAGHSGRDDRFVLGALNLVGRICG